MKNQSRMKTHFFHLLAWFMTAAAMLLTLNPPVEVMAEGVQIRADVELVGQLLDEAGEPLADEEALILINTGPLDSETETRIETDSEGLFRLRTSLDQSVYVDGEYQCVQLRFAVFIEREHPLKLTYRPGYPEETTEPGFYEKWLEAGTYNQDYVYLLQHIRRQPADSEPDFSRLSVTVGSEQSPFQIRLERTFTVSEHFVDQDENPLASPAEHSLIGRSRFEGAPPAALEKDGRAYLYAGWSLNEAEESQSDSEQGYPDIDVRGSCSITYHYRSEEETPLGVLTVRHWNNVTQQPATAEETIPFFQPGNSTLEIAPKNLESEGLAALRAELEGVSAAEAEPENPITSVAVEHQPGELLLEWYYHPDRDGDGVPDFQVEERFRLKDGGIIPEKEDVTTFHAHKERLEPQLPDIQGYRYAGYSLNESTQITAGTPPVMWVTMDTVYTYWYERDGGGSNGNGNGGGGEEREKPSEPEPDPRPEPPEPEPGLEPDPDPPQPEPLEPEPEPEAPPKEAENLDDQPSAPPSERGLRQASLELNEEERQALRNVTFVKRGLRQEAEPGQEVAYSFSGFENGYPYPIKGFTIIDRPDPGLDFRSISLPAFREGKGLSYQITCKTNLQQKLILVNSFPADQALKVESPPLSPGEYITEIWVSVAEAPPGFGVGDEIQIAFQIWDDPPKDELHNLGILFYEETGERVECQSDDTYPALTVRAPGGGRGIEGPSDSLSEHMEGSVKKMTVSGSVWKSTGLLILISSAVWMLRMGRGRFTT